MDLPIKLISTDFDGTIFAEFDSPPIPTGLVQLIGTLQQRGAKWAINTGREMSSLMESLARVRIPIQPDFLVLVEREIFERRDGRFESVAHWNDACARDHQSLFARVRADVPGLAGWVSSRFEAAVYEDPHSPLCIIAANNHDMDQIHTRLDEYARSVPHLTVVRNEIYARFSHVAYNKGLALAEITRLLGLSRDQVFVAGDHLNDLPMLSPALARCIASPANAVPAVLDVVTKAGGFVSRFPQGHGVNDALRYFLNGALA
jgi:hydroxymethylpyrimidine pyrophosphatase-like HAD family hydrolase